MKNKQFFEAIRNNDSRKVQDFLNSKTVKVNDPFNGSTPLKEAVKYGHLAISQQLINMNADVNEKIIACAKEKGKQSIIDLLLKNYTQQPLEELTTKVQQLNIEEEGYKNPFESVIGKKVYFGYICTGNEKKVHGAIVTKLGTIYTKDEAGNSGLHYAVNKQAFKVVEYLIGSKANVNAQNEDGNTPLHVAFEKPYASNMEKIKNVLLEAGAKSDIKNHAGLIPEEIPPHIIKQIPENMINQFFIEPNIEQITNQQTFSKKYCDLIEAYVISAQQYDTEVQVTGDPAYTDTIIEDNV